MLSRHLKSKKSRKSRKSKKSKRRKSKWWLSQTRRLSNPKLLHSIQILTPRKTMLTPRVVLHWTATTRKTILWSASSLQRR